MKKHKLTGRIYAFLFIVCILTSFAPTKQDPKDLIGAWQEKQGNEETVIIMTDAIFSSATYNTTEKKFISSYGGTWSLKGTQLVLKVEWNSKDSSTVGSEITTSFNITKNQLILEGTKSPWKRLDNGTPGELFGAWIITGSYNNDQVSKRRSPFFPRRTMKILSGKHFQWIAYNVVTKQFIDTGGGTYTTLNGKYTETIHFFTKTAASIGKSLSFDYSFVNGDWRHKGQKSTGGVMDECWTKREQLESKQ